MLTDERPTEQYQAIFEATTDGLVIRSLDGIVVEVNPAYCRMHGYTRDEVIGRPMTDFIHPDFHHLPAQSLKAIEAGQRFQAEAVNLRKDGSPLYIEVHGAAFTYRGQPHVLAVVRDITERVQAYQLLEQRVAERTRELSTLLEISRNVASTLELKPLLNFILDQLKFVADYSGASILTLQGDELVYLDYRRPSGLGHEVLPQVRYRVDRFGGIWDLLIAGKAAIVGDIRADSPLAEDYRRVVGKNLESGPAYMHAWMGVPLAVKERLIGMISLSHAVPDYYTPHHAELAMAIANQAAIAIENARLFAEVQNQAALQERQRLARELHDSVSQALYGIVLGAETARAYLATDPTRAAAPLEYVRSLAAAGLAEMKALIFELRPDSLATEGLVMALTKHVAALRARYELDVATSLGEEPSLPLEVKEGLYRIAQEAMHNVVKHAAASQVWVYLTVDGQQAVLEVRDNGAGFDVGGDFPGHLGLTSMRERAARMGGVLAVESAPGHGTRVHASIPHAPT